MPLVYAMVIMMGLMQSALFACLPWLIEYTPLSVSDWSWLVSGSMFGFVFIAPLWGRATDQYGPNQTLIWTFSGFALSNVILVLAISPWGLSLLSVSALIGCLILSRVIYAGFTAGVFGAAQAWVLGQADVEIRSALARLNAINQIGRMVGPLVVMLGAFWYPTLALYLFAIGAVLITAWFVVQQRIEARAGSPDFAGSPEFAGSPDDVAQNDSTCTSAVASLGVSISRGSSSAVSTETSTDCFSLSKALPELMLAMGVTMTVGTLQFSLGPYLKWQWGLSAEQATHEVSQLLFLSAFVVTLVAMKLVPRIAPLPKVYLLLTVAGLVFGSGLMVLAETKVVWCAAIALMSLGVALCSPFYGHVLRERWPEFQGRIGGYLTSAHTVGYGLGTLVAGRLLEWNINLAMYPVAMAALFLLLYLMIKWLMTSKETS